MRTKKEMAAEIDLLRTIILGHFTFIGKGLEREAGALATLASEALYWAATGDFVQTGRDHWSFREYGTGTDKPHRYIEDLSVRDPHCKSDAGILSGRCGELRGGKRKTRAEIQGELDVLRRMVLEADDDWAFRIWMVMWSLLWVIHPSFKSPANQLYPTMNPSEQVCPI